MSLIIPLYTDTPIHWYAPTNIFKKQEILESGSYENSFEDQAFICYLPMMIVYVRYIKDQTGLSELFCGIYHMNKSSLSLSSHFLLHMRHDKVPSKPPFMIVKWFIETSTH